MKACNNQGVSVLKPYYFVFRSSLILFTNRTSLELKSLLSPYFFVKHLGFQIGGAAYLQVWFIHGLLQYTQDKSIGLHFQITFGLFFKASPGAHLFIWKLVFIHKQMKTYFHMNRWAPGLALKTRPKVIWKWPIAMLNTRMQYLYQIKIIKVITNHGIN